jgi:hypothetical protein
VDEPTEKPAYQKLATYNPVLRAGQHVYLRAEPTGEQGRAAVGFPQSVCCPTSSDSPATCCPYGLARTMRSVVADVGPFFSCFARRQGALAVGSHRPGCAAEGGISTLGSFPCPTRLPPAQGGKMLLWSRALGSLHCCHHAVLVLSALTALVHSPPVHRACNLAATFVAGYDCLRGLLGRGSRRPEQQCQRREQQQQPSGSPQYMLVLLRCMLAILLFVPSWLHIKESVAASSICLHVVEAHQVTCTCKAWSVYCSRIVYQLQGKQYLWGV